MKKLVFVFAAFVAVSFASCGNKAANSEATTSADSTVVTETSACAAASDSCKAACDSCKAACDSCKAACDSCKTACDSKKAEACKGDCKKAAK